MGPIFSIPPTRRYGNISIPLQALIDGFKVYQMPINLETINSFYGVNLRPYEVDSFLKSEVEKEKIENPQNLEEKAVSLIGRPLYEAFIKGYTEKQWEKN